MGVMRMMAVADAFAGLFLVTAAAAGQRPQSADSARDREPDYRNPRSVGERLNTHDMAAFASLFHEDGVWIQWTGEEWTGRRTIEEGHAAVSKTIFRNSIHHEHFEELTFVLTRRSSSAIVQRTDGERAGRRTHRFAVASAWL